MAGLHELLQNIFDSLERISEDVCSCKRIPPSLQYYANYTGDQLISLNDDVRYIAIIQDAISQYQFDLILSGSALPYRYDFGVLSFVYQGDYDFVGEPVPIRFRQVIFTVPTYCTALLIQASQQNSYNLYTSVF